MNKELERELKALAKKHGMEVFFECTYCGEELHNDGAADHWLVTFSKEEDK
jgi:hypothetical protein